MNDSTGNSGDTNTNGNGNGTPTSRAEVLALMASLDDADRQLVAEVNDPATESDGLDRAEVLRSWMSLMGSGRRALLTAADAAAEEDVGAAALPVPSEADQEPPALTDAEITEADAEIEDAVLGDLPRLTSADIDWGEPVESTRDRSLGARLEHAIGTGEGLEIADAHLAAVQQWIAEHPKGCEPYGSESEWRDLVRFDVVKLSDDDYMSNRKQLAAGSGWPVSHLDNRRKEARTSEEADDRDQEMWTEHEPWEAEGRRRHAARRSSETGSSTHFLRARCRDCDRALGSVLACALRLQYQSVVGDHVTGKTMRENVAVERAYRPSPTPGAGLQHLDGSAVPVRQRESADAVDRRSRFLSEF